MPKKIGGWVYLQNGKPYKVEVGRKTYRDHPYMKKDTMDLGSVKKNGRVWVSDLEEGA